VTFMLDMLGTSQPTGKSGAEEMYSSAMFLGSSQKFVKG
jgi:hypothetical protein